MRVAQNSWILADLTPEYVTLTHTPRAAMRALHPIRFVPTPYLPFPFPALRSFLAMIFLTSAEERPPTSAGFL